MFLNTTRTDRPLLRRGRYVKRLLITTFCLVTAAFAFQSASQQKTSGMTIRGQVLQEPGGQPLRKTNVLFIARDGQSNGQYSGTTGADGRFEVDDVKPGRYLTTVEHPGFVQSASGKQRTLLVQAGQGTTDLVFYMQPAAVITGKILDLDGDPMSNVGISALRVGPTQRGMNSHGSGYAATNDLGEFRIPDLRAGRYRLSANPPQGLRAPHAEAKDPVKQNLIYTTTYYPGTLDDAQSVAVEVRPGDETAVNFGMLASPAYRVAGRVIGVPAGAPLAEMMLSSKARGEQNQQLGEAGKFEFQNVLPGSYTATVIVVTGLAEGRPTPKMMRVVEPIEVSTANVEGLQLQTNPGGTVKGKFRMDTGQRFDWTQLTVMLLPVNENDAGFLMAGSSEGPAMSGLNKDGSFELKNVTGGSYTLLVGAKSNNLRDYFTKSVYQDGRDVADSGFIVSAETSLDIVISASGATIEGTLVDSQGKPVAHATVVDVPTAEHRNRTDLYQRDITDERGHFSLRGLNPGRYTVLGFDELEADIRDPEFLKAYEGHGDHVQLDEGARASIVVKVITTEIEEP